MRITCVIGSLACGGAERQMSILAVQLKRRGHDVCVLVCSQFGRYDFFKPFLDEAGVPVECVKYYGRLHLIRSMRTAIRDSRPDVVIAFLVQSGMLAELAGLPKRDFALIVGERNLDGPGNNRFYGTMRGVVRFQLHRLADAIVTNSYAQRSLMEKDFPWMKERLYTIINGLDLDFFRPLEGADKLSFNSEELIIIVLGRFVLHKNHLRLLRAVDILNSRQPDVRVRVDSYGGGRYAGEEPESESETYRELCNAIEQSPVKDKFILHDPISDVLPLYHRAAAVCLPSLFEGCPNVICEAMACGLPVLASRVSDNSFLVKEGENGFLFDPESLEEIVDALLRFARLSSEEKIKMGKASRKRAEAMLSAERLVDEYERLIECLAKGD